MQGYFKKLTIDWLLETGSATFDADVSEDSADASEENFDYPLPESVGWAKASILKTSRSIWVYKCRQFYNAETLGSSYAFVKSDIVAEEDTFIAQVIDKGIIRQCGGPLENEMITKPNMASFRYSRDFETQPIYETNKEFTIAAMSINIPVLDLLIGEENRDVLLNAIGLKTLSNTASHPINPQIRKTLLDVVNPNLQGSMKLLYAEAKVLEFICSLQEFVSKYTESNISSKQNLKKVYELHEYLCKLDGELPKLEVLAKDFNMSLRNLNRVFSNEFGLPIYSFIRKYRLQEAHLAIEKSEVSQKHLAGKLGYSHVNNFRAAFKKEFNYSPGSLRK